MKNKDQGYCKVTGKYYASLDNHHIIPREYGGKDGPTVLLGPDIHQSIHRCANNPAKKDQFLSLLPNSRSRKLADRLIKTILQSKQAHKDKGIGTTKIIQFSIPLKIYERLSVVASNRNLSVPAFLKSMALQIVQKGS